MAKAKVKKRNSTRAAQRVETQIVELSLQHPELGARRLLPLLQKQAITVSSSTVYRILKRNNLENRQKRLLRLEALRAQKIQAVTEAEGPEPFAAPADAGPTATRDGLPRPVFEPVVATPIPPALETPAPEPISARALAAAAEPGRKPPPKRPAKTARNRSHWAFYPLYLLLLALIGHLGFQTVQAVKVVRLETEPVAAPGPAAAVPTAQPEVSSQPLGAYRVIWERDLFNIARASDSESLEKISLDKIVLAKKDLGLELVGTVVADDPQWSRAIIDNRKTREQEAYREGDQAGEVRIKKILRNNVVITTAEGDELLTVEIKETGNPVNPSRYAQQPSAISVSSLSAPGGRPPVNNPWYFSLARQEVEASLADTQPLLQGVTIAPYLKGDQAAGFKITNIGSESILKKIGLDNDDVISGLNEEAVTGPEQAADFFQKIAEGGEFKITIERNRRLRFISLNIQ